MNFKVITFYMVEENHWLVYGHSALNINKQIGIYETGEAAMWAAHSFELPVMKGFCLAGQNKVFEAILKEEAQQHNNF